MGADVRLSVAGFDIGRYHLVQIEVSERDLLDGAALAAAELAEPEEGLAPPTAFTCC